MYIQNTSQLRVFGNCVAATWYSFYMGKFLWHFPVFLHVFVPFLSSSFQSCCVLVLLTCSCVWCNTCIAIAYYGLCCCSVSVFVRPCVTLVYFIEMAGPLSTSQCCLLSRELRFRAPVMEQMPLLAFSLSEHWVEAEGEKIYYEKKTFSALRTGLKVIQRTIGQICVHLFKYLTETGEFFHTHYA